LFDPSFVPVKGTGIAGEEGIAERDSWKAEKGFIRLSLLPLYMHTLSLSLSLSLSLPPLYMHTLPHAG
jgi:hypothetical protein